MDGKTYNALEGAANAGSFDRMFEYLKKLKDIEGFKRLYQKAEKIKDEYNNISNELYKKWRKEVKEH